MIALRGRVFQLDAVTRSNRSQQPNDTRRLAPKPLMLIRTHHSRVYYDQCMPDIWAHPHLGRFSVGGVNAASFAGSFDRPPQLMFDAHKEAFIALLRASAATEEGSSEA